MYLFIYENGTTEMVETVTQDDLDACDDGICQIIDVSEADNPKDYYEGEWTAFELRQG